MTSRSEVSIDLTLIHRRKCRTIVEARQEELIADLVKSLGVNVLTIFILVVAVVSREPNDFSRDLFCGLAFIAVVISMMFSARLFLQASLVEDVSNMIEKAPDPWKMNEILESASINPPKISRCKCSLKVEGVVYEN